jgi:hypothetical protein
LRILLVSGMLENELLQMSELAGVDAVIPKGRIEAELVATIQTFGLQNPREAGL